MNKPLRYSGFLVSVCLFGVLFGCAHQAVDETELNHQMFNEVQAQFSQVEDSGRRDQLLDLLGSMQSSFAEMNRAHDLYAKKIRTLNADYDATREDFQSLFAKFNSDRKKIQQQLLTAHFKIKSLTTKKEWKAFAEVEGKAVSQFLEKSLLESRADSSGKGG